MDFEYLCNYKKLYAFICAKIIPNKKNYIFLDEIQHVPQFEKAVDSLFIKNNCDVYITGSNAYFMSSELATLLSGRYIELHVLPLSFKEFCVANKKEGTTNNQLFDKYITTGAFPYISQYDLDDISIGQYLHDLFNTILINDIVKRNNISDIKSLENIIKFLSYSIGNPISATKIANTLKSQNKKVDSKTVSKYIKALEDSLFLYEATRYDIKGKKYLTTSNKYYIVDIGFRNILTKNSEKDIGHIIENIVFLELLRREKDVHVGLIDGKEVDFVINNKNQRTYYQVSASTLDEKTLERELAPFKHIDDHFPKYLLTLDEIQRTANYNGVQKLNLIDWLLAK